MERAINPSAFLPRQELITDISADFPSELLPPSEKWQSRAEYFIQKWEQNLADEIGRCAREYLEKERGLTQKTWHAFRLGYNPFNLYDHPSQWGLDGKRYGCQGDCDPRVLPEEAVVLENTPTFAWTLSGEIHWCVDRKGWSEEHQIWRTERRSINIISAGSFGLLTSIDFDRGRMGCNVTLGTLC
jgi:hypothetical protein